MSGRRIDPTLSHSPRYPEGEEGRKAGSKVPTDKAKAKRRKARKGKKATS